MTIDESVSLVTSLQMKNCYGKRHLSPNSTHEPSEFKQLLPVRKCPVSDGPLGHLLDLVQLGLC